MRAARFGGGENARSPELNDVTDTSLYAAGTRKTGRSDRVGYLGLEPLVQVDPVSDGARFFHNSRSTGCELAVPTRSFIRTDLAIVCRCKLHSVEGLGSPPITFQSTFLVMVTMRGPGFFPLLKRKSGEDAKAFSSVSLSRWVSPSSPTHHTSTAVDADLAVSASAPDVTSKAVTIADRWTLQEAIGSLRSIYM